MHEYNSLPASSVSIQQTLARVRSLQSHRRARDAAATFVIEGVRQLIQAFRAGFEFDTLLHNRVLLRHSLAQNMIRKLVAQGVRRVTVSPEQFRSVSMLERASGVVAIVKQRWIPLHDVTPHAGLGWLVIERIRSAGNLGTILRTAEAVGMGGAMFVAPGRRVGSGARSHRHTNGCDPHSPGVVRASMGGIFHLTLVRTSPRELGLWLARHGIAALGLSAGASRLWTDLPTASGYAIVLGDEREGLSPAMRRLCDCEVRLPMSGRADSLNVSVAAGVMMYELARRRCRMEQR
jgi:TrmH family RNA methyltransferase